MADVPVDFRVNDTAGAGVSVTSRALSDSGGTVFAVFSAGTQAGPVTVVATADPDGLFGGPVTVESAPIAITGGIPNFANSSFSCPASASIFTPPASVGCTVTLVDRFTDVSTGSNLVEFRAEGGNITPLLLERSRFLVTSQQAILVPLLQVFYLRMAIVGVMALCCPPERW